MISHSDPTEPLPPLNKRQYTTLAAVGKVVERLGGAEYDKTVGDVYHKKYWYRLKKGWNLLG